MKNSNYNTHKVAVIGCGYWGSIITNSLLKIGIRNIYIYDQNYRNSLILPKYDLIQIDHKNHQSKYREKVHYNNLFHPLYFVSVYWSGLSFNRAICLHTSS